MGSRWPPPRDDGQRSGHGSANSYRPSQSSYASNPSRPSWDAPYQFRGNSRADDNRYDSDRRNDNRFDPYSDSRRDSGRDRDYARDSNRDFRPPQGDFTFRANRPPGVQESYDSYRGPPPSLRGDNDNYRPGQSRRENGPRGFRSRHGNSQRNGRGGSGFRGRGGMRKAADREFLHKNYDAENAENLLGDTTGRVTYRDIDELTDSEDAEMDISGDSEDEGTEPAAKRVRLNDDPAAQAAPKWSNPDPYTALPPPDETQRKKKDVVQMIRKARVEAEAKKDSATSDAAEFISFDMSDDEDNSHKAMSGNPQDSNSQNGQGVPGAPTGPRSTQPPTTLPSSLPPRPPETLLPPLPQEDLPQDIPIYTKPTSQLPPPPGKSARIKAPVDLSASTNFGSRKRTADDQIKERPHQPLVRGKKKPASAEIESSWRCQSDEDPCPWALNDHSSEPNMGVR